MYQHPERQRIVSEMHLRRWPELHVPCLLVQWVLCVNPNERDEEIALIDARAGSNGNGTSLSHREGVLSDGIRFSWERHKEGSSLTLFARNADPQAFINPASAPDIAAAIAWAESLPGAILRCTRIWVATDDDAALAILPALDLSRTELVSSTIGDHIRIWSDFRCQPDGYGRLLVAANGTDTHDLTRYVQRLQELGNYRNRALLGLPVAQEYWPQLDKAEDQLRILANRVANNDEKDDALMRDLSDLSLKLMAISTSISFRMDATSAYARLVEARLSQLQERPIEGHSSLTDFTQRRFRPAIRTCATIQERERHLSLRASQLSSLLRARIETRIENQNGQLLRSMDQSISMQLRLQQLVEGLSVVALSYYLIGLVGYFLKGPLHNLVTGDPYIILGWLVLPLMAAIWLVMHIVKRGVVGRH